MSKTRAPITIDATLPEKTAGIGHGAYEGADRGSRELASWRPRATSADALINDGRAKVTMDSRARDLLRNDGQVAGAATLQKDSIVGSQYRLNSQPAQGVLERMFPGLGFTEDWAEQFQRETEELFTLYAESIDSWIDVQRTWSFTGMIRMAVGCYFAGGEALLTCNWMRGAGRPFATAFQLVDCDRLSNPNGVADDRFLRNGVVLDRNAAPTSVWIRDAHPGDMLRGQDLHSWTNRPIYKSWGRHHTILLRNLQRPEQTRGVADMVTVLKETRMAAQFHETTLANAIANASFAATIESELPPEMAARMIGAENAGKDIMDPAVAMLSAISEYTRGGQSIQLGGVKIPTLFPGTKLKMLPAGTVGGVGDAFEASLLRKIAAGLGVSYEELTRDFSKTNYSSFRAAANQTQRSVTARKREVADYVANAIYRNWLEEAIDLRMIPSLEPMLAKVPDLFYRPLVRDALAAATWIGASRGQVDEMKETQAAVMRIKSGLSTYEIETARLGVDFREVFRQRAREKRLAESYGLDFALDVKKPGTVTGIEAQTNNQQEANNADADDE